MVAKLEIAKIVRVPIVLAKIAIASNKKQTITRNSNL